jgi:hypothetical protein
VAGICVYNTEYSEYALGREAGIKHVREMGAKGPFIRAGMNAANMIDLIPTNPGATPDWNAASGPGSRRSWSACTRQRSGGSPQSARPTSGFGADARVPA